MIYRLPLACLAVWFTITFGAILIAWMKGWTL